MQQGWALRAQSAVDFLVTYGWALLMISVLLALLFSYTTIPPNIAPGACNFYSSMSCSDIQLSTNALTMYIVNSQSFPVSSPTMYVSINSQNSITATCIPNFVLPGGEITCTISPLPVKAALGALASGYMYLSAAYCGLANNYALTGNCISAPTMTYAGSFSAHSEPQSNPVPYASNYIIYITVKNATQSHGTAKDPFYTQVMLGNNPVIGATLSFSLNNNAFYLQPSATLTNITGNALSYVWGGSGATNIILTASLGNVIGTPSNTANIIFT